MEKEFKLEELFSCAKGDVDLQQKDINGRGEYFINSGLENKGIKGRTDKEARVFPANTLTVDFWGNAFYRDFPYKLATHNHVFSLSSELLKNEKVGLYIEGALAKLPELFSYNNMATWNKLKDLTISLPVVPSADPDHAYTPSDIDWEYMERCIAELEEERVAELEEERVAELEAYLQATGLDDCDLTDEDERTLAEEPTFAEFRVADVFGKALHSKYHNPKDLVLDAEGYPYICASNANNGINKDLPRVNGDGLALSPKKIIAWGKQCPMFCVHSEACVTSQGMYFLDMTAYSDRVCLYICSALDKACGGKFDYSNCLIGKVMDEQVISLPVVPSADPAHAYTPSDIDWGYMERCIRATEKLVMAEVVAYKDRVIAETRRIVRSSND